VGTASSLVVAPNSNFLYVALPTTSPTTSQLAIYSIDNSTGILYQVGSNLNIGYAITQLVMSPGGSVLFGLSPSQQAVVSWTLNSSSGVAIQAATQSVGQGVGSPSYIVLSANGSYMYVLDHLSTTPITGTNFSTPNIFGFNVGSNGVLTQMADSPFPENPDADGNYPSDPVAGATTNDNRYLFVANQGTHNISVFKINSGASGSGSGSPGELNEVVGSVSIINGISVSTASPFDCGTGCSTPSFIAIPSGNNALYVLDPNANAKQGAIFQFQIDQNTGKLRAQSPASVGTAGAPTWITLR
jgi:6-phosphogluconolactonase (cycloisomerase 2 family)